MTICFGPFMLNLDTRQLTRGGAEIHLSTKAFDLRLSFKKSKVEKDEIIEALENIIRELRQAK